MLIKTWHLALNCAVLQWTFSEANSLHRTLIKKAKADSLTKPVRIQMVADGGIELTTKAFWTKREDE